MAKAGHGGMRRVDLKHTKLASSQTARGINRDILLEIIRTNQPISRADLSRRSGLQRSTVSQIVEQLIEERWVREGAMAHLPRGRRPTLVGLNSDLVVIAADLHPQQATAAVVDLQGRLISRIQVPLGSDPHAAIRRLIAGMRELRTSHPDKSFEGVGISVPGRVDSKTRQLIFAPNLKWGDFDIKATVERAMELPVEMENAANACLLAELWFERMDGIRNAVLLTVAEGIGGAILANGNVIRGQNGLAGEFGHVSLDPSGPRCGCGQSGCLEVFASCRAALRYYAESSNGGSAALSFHQLLARAEEGDPRALDAIRRQAEYLARGLQLVIAALSPEVILLAGDITSAWRHYGPPIEKRIKSLARAGTPPRVLPTHQGEIARLRGAAAVMLQRHSRLGERPVSPAAENRTMSDANGSSVIRAASV
ncbi:MAG TPA: ROK family transcriptional regulator [Acidobacteriaceae bacterium]|nr:ROK family transcriptional regulator [Acidobacteriaceae bacterium]